MKSSNVGKYMLKVNYKDIRNMYIDVALATLMLSCSTYYDHKIKISTMSFLCTTGKKFSSPVLFVYVQFSLPVQRDLPALLIIHYVLLRYLQISFNVI